MDRDMDISVTLTKNPKQKPDAHNLPFGKIFTDHMFIMEYTDEKGWHDARIEPYGPMALDPAATVFHYAQTVFEGLKAYKAEDGRVLLFRPEMNFARMNLSAERLCMPEVPEDFGLRALDALVKIDQDWIPTGENTSLYVRPYLMGVGAALGVHPSSRYIFAIILAPSGPYYDEGINPVKICIEDKLVRAVRGGTGFTKAAANYAISLKGQEKAEEMGFAQVLWLDGVEHKYIDEVGAMNVFFVLNGELITPGLNEGNILAGITRDSIIRLTKSWGMAVTERRITAEELFKAHADGRLEEAFGSGTAAVISPIGQFTWGDRSIIINNGEIGEISKRIYDELTGIQYGKLPDKFNWMHEVK